MTLHAPDQVELNFKLTGGERAEFDGVETWGHFEQPPGETDDPYDGPGMLITTPSFVMANGVWAEIGVDLVEGARGAGEVITIFHIVDGVEVPHSWRVTNVIRRQEDGSEIRCILRDED